MCGIAGELRHAEERDGHIAQQLRTLRHRGPDAEGAFEQPLAWVGQTRLAVIDLESGDPPILNEDRTIAVALNGEIYNYRELQAGLRARGHTLSSRGDTEVIAHLAEELDPAELARSLDGMFAFAVWDERRQRLILGRDRFGKKPLFYWTDGRGRLVFASEIKGILANPDVPRRMRQEAIHPYLAFGYVPTPDTFFEAVRSVPPGHVLTAEPGEEPAIERFWQPPVAGVDGVTYLDVSIEQAADRVRDALAAAVQKRLISDVPLGAFLSGGIDSTAVVGLMAGEMDRPVETFTIGFEDDDVYDERPFARLAAERHRTDHHEFVVRPDAIDLIESLVWYHDQPFGDSSAVPTYLLSKLTRSHVTVALSGDGGDELFAGYERFAAALLTARYKMLPRPVRRALERASERLAPHSFNGRASSLQRFVRVAGGGLPYALSAWAGFIGERELRLLLDGGPADQLSDEQGRIWADSAGAGLLDRLLDFNLRTYLLDDLLVKADRMSMAHGLEVRSPFLDFELHALTSRLRPELKARGFSLKRVLRAAVADLVPDEIMSRRKRGFGVPLDRWFRHDLRAFVKARLGAADAATKRHLAPAAIDQLLAEHDSGSKNHGHALWTLLTLELFLRREGW